jgi:hypothetical protein
VVLDDWLVERDGFELAVPLVQRENSQFLQLFFLREETDSGQQSRR